jgi:hypothetical protein
VLPPAVMRQIKIDVLAGHSELFFEVAWRTERTHGWMRPNRGITLVKKTRDVVSLDVFDWPDTRVFLHDFIEYFSSLLSVRRPHHNTLTYLRMQFINPHGKCSATGVP